MLGRLALLLPACLSNDNAARCAAERELAALAEHPDSIIPALLSLLRAPETEGNTRSLAATVLSWKLGALWGHLGAAERDCCADAVLASLDAASPPLAGLLCELASVLCQCAAGSGDDQILSRVLRGAAAAARGGGPPQRAALRLSAQLVDSLGARVAAEHEPLAALASELLGSPAGPEACQLLSALAGSWALSEAAAARLRAAVPRLLAQAAQEAAALEALSGCLPLLDRSEAAAVAEEAAARVAALHSAADPAARLARLALLRCCAARGGGGASQALALRAPQLAQALTSLCASAEEDEGGEGAGEEGGAAAATLEELARRMSDPGPLPTPALRLLAQAAPPAAQAAALRALSACARGRPSCMAGHLEAAAAAMAAALGPAQPAPLRAAAAAAAAALLAELPLETAEAAVVTPRVGASLLAAAVRAMRDTPTAVRLLALLCAELGSEEVGPHADAAGSILLPMLGAGVPPATAAAAAAALGAVAAAAPDAFGEQLATAVRPRCALQTRYTRYNTRARRRSPRSRRAAPAPRPPRAPPPSPPPAPRSPPRRRRCAPPPGPPSPPPPRRRWPAPTPRRARLR